MRVGGRRGSRGSWPCRARRDWHSLGRQCVHIQSSAVVVLMARVRRVLCATVPQTSERAVDPRNSREFTTLQFARSRSARAGPLCGGAAKGRRRSERHTHRSRCKNWCTCLSPLRYTPLVCVKINAKQKTELAQKTKLARLSGERMPGAQRARLLPAATLRLAYTFLSRRLRLPILALVPLALLALPCLSSRARRAAPLAAALAAALATSLAATAAATAAAV